MREITLDDVQRFQLTRTHVPGLETFSVVASSDASRYATFQLPGPAPARSVEIHDSSTTQVLATATPNEPAGIRAIAPPATAALS